MDFKKLSPPSMKNLFVKELENMILSGALKVGDKLPPEREIAKTMGISRAVVNSGINEAAAKGFLRIKPRSGTFVEDYRQSGKLETLISIMNFNDGLLRQNEIKSLLELRTVLDILTIRLIVENIPPLEIERLESFVAAIKKFRE